MTYERTIQVEFNHCDPAGIVFYPRYFEMVNSVVENFFADVVGRSFARMHNEARNGVPTVAIEAAFRRPSRLGDRVQFTLKVEAVGRSSARVLVKGSGADENRTEDPRMQVRMTIAWIDNLKAQAWPDAMRTALLDYMETQDAP
jgi:4-hydroxybenzoyl-CoA thioesterase